MKAHQKPLEEFGASSHTPSSNPEHARKGVDQLNYLKHVERFRLYTAVAAMLDAGLQINEAVQILSSEYQANRQRRESEVVRRFLDTLLKARTGDDKVQWTTDVDKIMGRGFVFAEEMALLRSMAGNVQLAPLFRAAAAILASHHDR